MPSSPDDNYASSSDLEVEASPHFVEWLHSENVSLALTTYQTNRLFLIGHNEQGGLSGFERLFDRPMGLHAGADGGRLTMATRYQIRELVNALPPGETHEGYDRMYVPRRAYTTGELDAHDLHRTPGGDIRFVNTQFNCIAAPSDTHSFRSVWTPPFISEVVPEDRCHLNGLAMADGEVRYATAVSPSDVAAGWRDRREGQGVVVDVQSGEIVADGLTMPHSPRLHDGDLYLLNAGTGELGRLDRAAGTFEALAFCPGFGRGLAFRDRYAIVGLSKLRHDRIFQELPLGKRLEEKNATPQCGVRVIDLTTGATVHWLTFSSIIEELYDVQVLPGVQRPMALGFKTNEIRRFITVEHEDGPRRFLIIAQSPESSDADGRESEADGTLPSLELPGPVREASMQSAQTRAGTTPRFHTGRVTIAQLVDRFASLVPKRMHRRMNAEQLDPTTSLVSVVATQDDQPIGLAAVRPTEESSAENPAVLEALSVVPPQRGRGLATALLHRIERLSEEFGIRAVKAEYRDDLPSQAALERVFAKRNWGTPTVRVHLFEGHVSDWLQRPEAQKTMSSDEVALLGWAELTEDEQAQVAGHLGPERDRVGEGTSNRTAALEPTCTVAARGPEDLLGWIVAHRVTPSLVQYTKLHVLSSHRRQGIGFSLIVEAVQRQHELTDAPKSTFMVQPDSKKMLSLIERYIAPSITKHVRQIVLGKRLESSPQT